MRRGDVYYELMPIMNNYRLTFFFKFIAFGPYCFGIILQQVLVVIIKE